ncbi:hypothetical protein EV648_12530 [Kribbella sp. VKM Ac-2568]|nr:hypothetical protein EV648_12530 [Kribbella sp. VKM Ac-2568]
MSNPVWSTSSWIEQLPTAQGSELRDDQALYPGDSLTSPNGRYSLTYQGDGNLVVWGPAGSVVWASGTGGKPAGLCKLVRVGGPIGVSLFGPGMTLIWAKPGQTELQFDDHPRLVIQDDGNLVLLGTMGYIRTPEG